MAKRKITAADSDGKPFTLGYRKFGRELLFYVDTPLECVTLSLDLEAMARFVADAGELLAAERSRQDGQAAAQPRRFAAAAAAQRTVPGGAGATMVT